jgi:hypothetical protein
LYFLMFALPLVGWGMLSAADYPIVLFSSLSLPPILPHNAELYAGLRTTHTILAFLLFATFIGHFSGAMMHALIFRDGIFESMASWKTMTSKTAIGNKETRRQADCGLPDSTAQSKTAPEETPREPSILPQIVPPVS